MENINEIIDDLIIDIESNIDHRDYEDENKARHQIDILELLKTKVSPFEARVSPMLAKWQTEKPNKPCLFVARYDKKDEQPSLVYAVYDTDVLCVTDTEHNFVCTMEEYADCEYYIIEYI